MLRHAFSLVELLVVLGIIVVLVALLLPAVNAARQQAVAVECASQLRQVGTALTIYTENNRGMYPTWSGWQSYPNTGTGEDETLQLGWIEQLESYFVKPDSPVYHCKAFPEEYRINYFLAARWTHLRDPAAGWYARPMKRSDIRNSSEFVLSGDCTQQGLYPPLFGTVVGTTICSTDMDDASLEAIVFRGSAGGVNMHRGGNNVLFGDNHVQLFRKFEPNWMSYHPRRRSDWASVTGD